MSFGFNDALIKSDDKNVPEKPIAVFDGFVNEPETFKVNPLPVVLEVAMVFSNTLPVPSVGTASTGCNMCDTYEAELLRPVWPELDCCSIAIAPLVNLYPASYNKRVTVITLPFCR